MLSLSPSFNASMQPCHPIRLLPPPRHVLGSLRCTSNAHHLKRPPPSTTQAVDMGALASKCLPSDPAKLEGAITKAFGMFDKDKSGFVEGPEAVACARQVLKLAKITSVTDAQVTAAFAKVAGPDQKLDQAEFAKLVHMLVGNKPAAGAAATPAAAAAPVAAAP